MLFGKCYCLWLINWYIGVDLVISDLYGQVMNGLNCVDWLKIDVHGKFMDMGQACYMEGYGIELNTE